MTLWGWRATAPAHPSPCPEGRARQVLATEHHSLVWAGGAAVPLGATGSAGHPPGSLLSWQAGFVPGGSSVENMALRHQLLVMP